MFHLSNLHCQLFHDYFLAFYSFSKLLVNFFTFAFVKTPKNVVHFFKMETRKFFSLAAFYAFYTCTTAKRLILKLMNHEPTCSICRDIGSYSQCHPHLRVLVAAPSNLKTEGKYCRFVTFQVTASPNVSLRLASASGIGHEGTRSCTFTKDEDYISLSSDTVCLFLLPVKIIQLALLRTMVHRDPRP